MDYESVKIYLDSVKDREDGGCLQLSGSELKLIVDECCYEIVEMVGDETDVGMGFDTRRVDTEVIIRKLKKYIHFK